jgi:hypothetical protein
VAPAFRAVPRYRCSTGFSSGLLAQENRTRWRVRRGKPRGIFPAHSHGPEERVHAPLAGNRRIVAQYICGHRALRIMQTYPAVSQGGIWTLDAQPDAVLTEGTLIEDSHPVTPRAVAAARRRRGTLAAGKRMCSVRRSRGWPQPFWARTSRAPGDQRTRVSMHAERGCRGAHPWPTDAAPSGDLRCARHRQPDESLFG